ncbi:MAG: hypothetical protein HC889_03230, partial [Synechococcaceae cyanobacterium SM1_2_3]|nr:hypothetical protein [Synechococcaceae cyanobacterium SM1_2_3]
MSIAVIAEKPSVARDIAKVLGASQRGEGFLHGNGYVVTWAIGHLTRLAEPHEINPDWKRWRRELLPMLPERWPLIISDQTRDQFEKGGLPAARSAKQRDEFPRPDRQAGLFQRDHMTVELAQVRDLDGGTTRATGQIMFHGRPPRWLNMPAVANVVLRGHAT